MTLFETPKQKALHHKYFDGKWIEILFCFYPEHPESSKLSGCLDRKKKQFLSIIYC